MSKKIRWNRFINWSKIGSRLTVLRCWYDVWTLPFKKHWEVIVSRFLWVTKNDVLVLMGMLVQITNETMSLLILFISSMCKWFGRHYSKSKIWCEWQNCFVSTKVRKDGISDTLELLCVCVYVLCLCDDVKFSFCDLSFDFECRFLPVISFIHPLNLVNPVIRYGPRKATG